MIDLEELKKLAEKINDGDWYRRGADSLAVEDSDDSEFIAAAEPSVILELIARIESASVDAQRYQWMIEHGAPEDWQAVGNQDKQFRSTYVDTFIRKGDSHD